jgi:hypothetical protein
MMRRRADEGYALVDVVMGLVLFGLVLLAVYRILIPAFALSHSTDERLAVQQDVRLAIDRMARQLHETTLRPGRVRVYSPEAGCAAAYEGCIALVTARNDDCTGPFQLLNGAPDWQATIYLWRDTASNELRSRCDSDITFPPPRWPPAVLTPYRVIGTRVVAASFTLLPAGSPLPTAVAVALEEQTPAAAGPRRVLHGTFFNETTFAPENR